MEIIIQTASLRLPERELGSLRQYVRERIEEAFARIKRRVVRVSVHFEDLNGDRGGIDKQCVVKVSLGGATAALVQGRDHNAFALINRVTASAAGVTLKRLKRRPHHETIRRTESASTEEAA